MAQTVTMDIEETLAISLEKLRKLGNEKSEQLHNTEKYIQDEISALLDAEVPLREVFMKTIQSRPILTGTLLPNLTVSGDRNHAIQLSGSVVEGAMTARMFQVNKDLEVEIDVMCNMFTVPQEVSHLLEPVKDKTGFVRLPVCLCPIDRIGGYIATAKRFLERHEKEQYSLSQIQKYISPLVIKDHFKVFSDRSPACVSDLYSKLRDIFGLDIPYHKTSVNYSLKETTVASELQGMPVLSADWVPAVHLSFWPGQASKWIICYRVWPPRDTIQNVVDEGCQVVPRTSPGGDVHSEWRLSFSKPEASLAKLRSKEQEQAYYFVKVFFYRYLKCVETSETEGKMLYSYVIKTIMLWACEELHPEDPIWASLESSVQMLLVKLLGSLEAGLLSHYFIPEINLLERVGQDVRNHWVAVISRWQNNILITAPFDMPEKWNIINFLSIANTQADIFWSDITEMVKKWANKA